MKKRRKRKHLSDNNKGFSLVELIVTMLISTIITTAVAGFLSMGTQFYRRTNAETVLQTESQIAELFLTELIQEASEYTVLDTTSSPFGVTDAVRVVRDGAPVLVVKKGNQLWYGSAVGSSDMDQIEYVAGLGKAEAFLASHVEEFKVTPEDHGKAITDENGIVKIDFTFKVDEREYKESAFVSLRNKERN